jgi:hypothetical protein
MQMQECSLSRIEPNARVAKVVEMLRDAIGKLPGNVQPRCEGLGCQLAMLSKRPLLVNFHPLIHKFHAPIHKSLGVPSHTPPDTIHATGLGMRSFMVCFVTAAYSGSP